jgi:poly(A) polymerase
VRAVCRRLKLSNEELEQIVWLVSHQHALDEPAALSQAQLKRLLAHPLSPALRNLLRARLLAEGSSLAAVEFLDGYLGRTPPEELDPPPLITGDDLIALALAPGRQFEVILTAVRDAQLNEALVSREDALNMARRLAAASD